MTRNKTLELGLDPTNNIHQEPELKTFKWYKRQKLLVCAIEFEVEFSKLLTFRQIQSGISDWYFCNIYTDLKYQDITIQFSSSFNVATLRVKEYNITNEDVDKWVGYYELETVEND